VSLQQAKNCLLPLLADQLTLGLASLRAADPKTCVVLMAEVEAEAVYVRHHKKKVIFLFAAMRHFAAELRQAGWRVDYIAIDDPDNTHTLESEAARALERHSLQHIVVTHPGEFRVLAAMETWADKFAVETDILPDDRFLCSTRSFNTWAKDRKQLRMEYFYRDMRRQTGLLMNGDEPEGGQWNFDSDNRKPPNGTLQIPGRVRFEPDAITREVIALVNARFGDHFGAAEPFWFAVTAADARIALENFLSDCLPQFGDYQDAMLTDESFLFHAVIGLYVNAGLLDPLVVCQAAEAEYRAGRAPLNAVEGFIRQIIGWREYIRGIYWRFMPDYAGSNFFAATRDLPAFYWSGDTDMACLRATIRQTSQEAYAHHIQRLMITGNFALLAGIDPRQVHEWYLAVYADAYEWVELPNTLGMALFADGGLLASKPYAASGNYINRMSNYCAGCAYDVAAKVGKSACPFNYLYWDFLARNRDRLGANPRLGTAYRTYDKLPEPRRAAIAGSAADFLLRL
jgi:deoxyribodipyrimidine photolyase-related protein